MKDGEFEQVVQALHGLNIDGLLAVRNMHAEKTIIVSLQWDTTDLINVLHRIELSIMEWSFADETLIYFEFHN